MRGLIIFISAVLLVSLVIGKSGVIRVVPYTAMEGPLKVEKTRIEWHFEKLNFVKALTQRRSKFSPAKAKSLFPQIKKKKKPTRKLTHRLVLTNGAILEGSVVQTNAKGVLFGIEDGEIFFRHDEITSLEEKNQP